MLIHSQRHCENVGDAFKVRLKVCDVNKSRPLCIVAIGASAGGLEAIERLLGNFPVDTRCAFVVVQHLSPDFKSLMNELLSRHTSMVIEGVQDGQLVLPDHIYLAPPKFNVEFSEDRLWLKSMDTQRSLNHPIDHFFISLANTVGPKSIVVVLSGTGSDGTRGVRAVKEAGGLVVVQDPRSATFDGMPRSAIATGSAQLVCRPEVMPAKIMGFLSGLDAQASADEETAKDNAALLAAGDVASLFVYFQKRYGVDFSLYKPATIHRRLARRMEMAGCELISDYLKQVLENAEEADSLYRDLLVEVTRFFRDDDAFEKLRTEIIPAIVANVPQHQSIRAWVPGCATGEEAYSLAMLFANECNQQNRSANVRIFASDLHEDSLKFASAALYSAHAASNIPKELCEKYLQQQGDMYAICPEIRRMVNFTVHDLTEDPPFTRLDFLSCRNVLIYFESNVQLRVIRQFQFALKTGGYLFLGPSESLGALSKEFETIDNHCRIFRKSREFMASTLEPISFLPNRLSIRDRSALAVKPTVNEESQILNLAYESLLTQYMPPSVVVNEDLELLHCFGDARLLLQVPQGKSTLNICRMLQPELSAAVGLLISQTKTRAEANLGRVAVVFKGEHLKCNLRAQTCERNGRRYYIVIFEMLESDSKLPVEEISDQSAANRWREQVIELERRLEFTQQSLQSTVEELETSNEELQSTNEELTAANEELQSTNEELQSVNEELYSVNDENKQRIDDLVSMTEDLDNLITNSGISCVFLDSHLRITRFSPSISVAFDLIRDDIGRPLNNFLPKLSSPQLIPNAKRVLDTGLAVSTEVTGSRGTLYFERIAPYHDSSGDVCGVMILYSDVSILLTARELQERIERLGIGSEVAVWEWPNTHEDAMWWSHDCFTMFGYSPGEIPAHFSTWKSMLHPDDAKQIESFGTANCPIVKKGSIECRLRTKDGKYLNVLLRAMFSTASELGYPRMTGSIVLLDVESNPGKMSISEDSDIAQAATDESNAQDTAITSEVSVESSS